MSKLRIAIYNGDLKPTSFVKLLVDNLAKEDLNVCFLGTSNKIIPFNSGALKYIPTDTNSKFIMVLFIITKTINLLLKSPKQLITILIILNNTNLSLRVKIKKYLTWCTVLSYNPEILHLQWVSHIALFEELLDKKYFKICTSLRGRLINISPFVDENLANLYRRTFPKIDYFHAISNYTLQDALCFGNIKQKAKIIMAAVSDDIVDANLEPKSITPIKIISIGRENWVKGYIYALKALKILKEKGIDFEYTIVRGYSEELVYYVNILDLTENVIFVDSIPHAELPNFLKMYSFFLFPSISEGMGNVVLESMASGLVVIATKSGGVEDVIIHNKNGFLANTYDSESIANTLFEVIKLNKERLFEIRSEASKTIVNNHLLSQQISNMKKMYHLISKL